MSAPRPARGGRARPAGATRPPADDWERQTLELFLSVYDNLLRVATPRAPARSRAVDGRGWMFGRVDSVLLERLSAVGSKRGAVRFYRRQPVGIREAASAGSRPVAASARHAGSLTTTRGRWDLRRARRDRPWARRDGVMRDTMTDARMPCSSLGYTVRMSFCAWNCGQSRRFGSSVSRGRMERDRRLPSTPSSGHRWARAEGTPILDRR